MNNKRLKLKSRTIEYGYTLSDIAKVLGVSNPTIWNKYNSKAPFLFREVIEISKLLDISPDDMELFFT